MKKFGKYFTLTLLFLLGLCCIGVLYLFFVPGSTLFTITYLSYNDNYISKSYDASSINKLIVNSYDYNLNIKQTEDDEIYAKVYSNSFGFALKKHSKTSITTSKEGAVLTINIAEPHGATLKNSSYIDIFIPEDVVIDLSLNNNKAKTTISNKDLTIKTLNYTTKNGDFHFKAGKITGNLNLTLNKSIFKIYEGVTTNNNATTLNLTSGKFDASHASLGDVKITNNTRGIILIKNCQTLREEVNAGGRIEIAKASHLNIMSTDTNIYVGEVTDSAIVHLLKSGNLTIDTLSGSSDISSVAGNITINNVKSNLLAKSTDGNITINNAIYAIDVETEYGSIFVNYSASAPANSANAEARKLIAKLNNGKLSAYGVEKAQITVTNNGRVYLEMNNVSSNSYVKGKNGSVYVKVKADAVYKLTTNPEIPTNGYVRVNLTQTPEYNGYTNKDFRETYVNCTKSTYNNNNSLTVSTTTGDLTIVDSNFN